MRTNADYTIALATLQELLFEQLAQLLNSALGQLGEERRSTVRCSVGDKLLQCNK